MASEKSKSAEHVRPALRQRPAKSSTPTQNNDTSKQDMTTAALKAPGLCGLEKSESVSHKDMASKIQSSGVSISGSVQSSVDFQVLPLGRKASRLGKRRSRAQKHVEDVRSQALLQAQQAGATGNFKSLDSEFNNFLIPVIPIQFSAKSKHSSNELD